MKKHHVGLLVEKNAFTDEGEGVVSFPNGLPITDNSEQRNGTRYDIDSMNINEYKGQMTADHEDKLSHVIAQVEGVAKVGTQVVVKKIQYLIRENPYARLAYNLLLARKTSDFSIETYGPMPDEEGVYYNAILVGLSQVVVGNNRNATVNQIVLNSLEQSKEDGLDTTELEEHLNKTVRVEANHSEEDPTKNESSKEDKQINKKEEKEMTYKTVKNSRDFALTIKYKNASDEEVETELAPGAGVDVSEDQAEAVEAQVNAAEAPKSEKKEDEGDAENKFAAALAAALAPMQEKLDKMEKNQFDKGAQEPKFKKDENGAGTQKNQYEAMDWKDRHAKQINAAWEWKKNGRAEAAQILNDLNEMNLAELKKEGLVSNSMTISDFGNFVISRELLTQIEGCRNDYTALVNATEWKETLSTQFAWLKRSGDINMQSVEFCDDGANGNLKPISEYAATIETSDLEELAAVTPVCNAATRFLAADLLGDVAIGYRNDYDRKRAQLVIARLEQAVEENGNSVVYGDTDTVDTLTDWVDVWAEIATCTPNGTFIFNTSTYAEIMKRAVQHGVNGPLGSIFITGEVPTIFGRPFIVVPDDLLPTLNTAQTKQFAVDGATVTVNHAVFYANLGNFTGRTSGGLMYDLSTEAAYEDGGTVKSAYQRNELVLRGSFFRGGAIKDTDQVSGLLSPGVS